ncbi:MAG TPA: LLM class flavin-dependent oxidoreductase [Ilumatobacteraceae bacterium]|nr:LLM class flavin-dependent oxidoreductase [Ilumatobacteraceae bacterium]
MTTVSTTHTRPFRFGYQVSRGLDDLREQARAAEAGGFDVISTWDHVGTTISPLLALVAMADATERIRFCPMVINNDFHHPAQLAMEFADLDQLSGGRAELGIGAGHSFTEYAAMGLAFGTHDEIAAHLLSCRERWGISYFTVRTIDDMAPIIERLRAADAGR